MVHQSCRLPLPERLFLNCGLLSACSLLSGSHVKIYVSWYMGEENPSLTENLSLLADNSPSMPAKNIARPIDLESLVITDNSTEYSSTEDETGYPGN